MNASIGLKKERTNKQHAREKNMENEYTDGRPERANGENAMGAMLWQIVKRNYMQIHAINSHYSFGHSIACMQRCICCRNVKCIDVCVCVWRARTLEATAILFSFFSYLAQKVLRVRPHWRVTTICLLPI